MDSLCGKRLHFLTSCIVNYKLAMPLRVMRYIKKHCDEIHKIHCGPKQNGRRSIDDIFKCISVWKLTYFHKKNIAETCWMGLMQQATHPMWYYVRGRLRKQAAITHSIENSVILDGSRHVCTNLMSYTHLYVLITTYSWDETFDNDDNLKKSENEFFCGKDSQGTATVSETESCNFIRVPQGCTPVLKYITIVN